MKHELSRTAMVVMIGLFLLSSCGGTKLTNPWVNSAYEGRYVKSVLVVGISKQFDKRKLEEAFAVQFQAHGVKAVSLASIAVKKEMTGTDVRAEAVKLGSDATFTVRLVGITEKARVDRVNPPRETTPEWNYSFPIYMVQSPPMEYKFEEKDIVMESELYDVSTGNLMWKVRSQIVKTGSTEKLIDQASKTVINSLQSARMIR
ncbi:MAG TPA: hypothetical protein VLZ07_12560 [Syntrophales bacterium]|nr:hypothetical protein [Syntrophales bacterium]